MVTGLTALLLLGFSYWKVILIITLLHGLIDLAKAYTLATLVNFMIDQALHILVILVTWAIIFKEYMPGTQQINDFYTTGNFWIFAAGIFFLTFPSSIIIGKATSFWNVAPGLKNAGKYIGIIERVIIFILVYQGQYEAIGLLVTGKSILRYNSTHEEEKTEYLLIGTFLSIFIAFIVGLTLKYAMH